MKRICIGIMAHVDAGKTTLSEGLLYLAGNIRRLGRVDHGDAFLDTDDQERERGITIFSKQAILRRGDMELTLLDTPGHVDFSSETERAVQVLDYAVLLISGTDGVQGHTETLWRILERQRVPTVIFVNKMDQPGTDRDRLMEQLKARLSDGCADFSGDGERVAEQAALCDERLLERYLEGERPDEDDLRSLIAQRKLFPCFFGSALRLEGVEELLEGLERYTLEPDWPGEFAARVFKVGRDEKGERLSWIKVTGGTLRTRSVVKYGETEEKVNQIRLYSGSKFLPAEEVPAGTVCAVTGLSRTFAGQGLGEEENWSGPELEPVLLYQVIPPENCDIHTLLGQLRLLEEEDPQLRVEWDERLGEIRLRLMGEVQLEVLRTLILRRFGTEVSFGPGSIVYLETIEAPVVGVGHFEPLRHYAEVHLLLEPLERGAGIVLDTVCSEDVLDRNWQRLILTHLAEKQHLGVLTGSPITDMKITLLTGKAHLKHTEGGDFRQATYRAVRQGLMSAKSVLLEPWYSLRLEVPPECVGRAMTDLQRMGGSFEGPEQQGEMSVLTGSAPVSEMGDYWTQVAAYTQGRGRLSCSLEGYRPCHDSESVVAGLGYDPLRDTEHPSESVFCAHGGSVTVPWNEAPAHMHLDSGWSTEKEEREEESTASYRPMSYESHAALEKELEAIFARTYGPVKPRAFQNTARRSAPEKEKVWKGLKRAFGEEYLLVDGYNIIHGWDELRELSGEDLDGARIRLIDRMRNYQGWRKNRVIVVFDAYKVKGNPGSVERFGDLFVVYTKEAETADMYIEKTTYKLSKENRVRVATSDGLEQMIILGHGAVRVSAAELEFEVKQVEAEIRRTIGGM
ncbi:MAG: TetM/TetW/TetO/TetS family tetracycline resistance ribosomal protection protein [Oscillospiraceae bacterium]|nr:TetM/TetW/TetO/TetS family tetracycline resistance ribosomal protection protein [Oscillospiraceae bacterium]